MFSIYYVFISSSINSMHYFSSWLSTVSRFVHNWHCMKAPTITHSWKNNTCQMVTHPDTNAPNYCLNSIRCVTGNLHLIYWDNYCTWVLLGELWQIEALSINIDTSFKYNGSHSYCKALDKVLGQVLEGKVGYTPNIYTLISQAPKQWELQTDFIGKWRTWKANRGNFSNCQRVVCFYSPYVTFQFYLGLRHYLLELSPVKVEQVTDLRALTTDTKLLERTQPK